MKKPCALSFLALFVALQNHFDFAYAAGDDHDDHESCACVAEELGFTINCSDEDTQVNAVSALNANNCGTDCSSDVCKKNYYIVQSHHDYCPEAGIPKPVEDGIHDFETACEDCEITRLADFTLPKCPTVNCDNGSGDAAYLALLDNGCLSDCAQEPCTQHFRTLRAVHDTCDEDALAESSERGLHDFEESCAK